MFRDVPRTENFWFWCKSMEEGKTEKTGKTEHVNTMMKKEEKGKEIR